MYIAKFAGHTIYPGDEVALGNAGMKFRVLRVRPDHFEIVWLMGGEYFEKYDIMNFDLLEMGNSGKVEVVELNDIGNDPNRSFLLKKLEEGR